MSFNVLYTDNFERELKRLAKKHKSLKKDLSELIAELEETLNEETLLVIIATRYALQ